MTTPLRLAHYHQLLVYAEMAEEEGTSYGNEKRFKQRHEEIIAFLYEQIAKLQVKNK